MQRIHKEIPGKVLGSEPELIYSAPVSTVATVNNLSFTNASNLPVTLDLAREPVGGSGNGVRVTLLSGHVIAANRTYIPPQTIGLALSAGSALIAHASAEDAIHVAGGVYETSGSP